MTRTEQEEGERREREAAAAPAEPARVRRPVEEAVEKAVTERIEADMQRKFDEIAAESRKKDDQNEKLKRDSQNFAEMQQQMMGGPNNN